MTPVTILHETEVELWEAVGFYESRCAGLGLDFEKEIKAAVGLIQQSPDRWPIHNDATRAAWCPHAWRKALRLGSRTSDQQRGKEQRMPDKLKQKISEFVALAKDCPENLQEKCFELLLDDYLHQTRPKGPADGDEGKQTGSAGADDKKEEADKKTAHQEDIVETDLHVKSRQFLKKAGLSVADINQLFYKEEGNFLPLYDDLKTTKGSESQVRIALLHALVKGMHTGEFECDGEAVRKEAQDRKCYDAANFAAHFKNNKELFEGFTKYNKASPTLRLSAEGKAKLAEIIRDIG